VNDCCLARNESENVRFVLDQQALLNFYTDFSLNQESVGRNVCPLRHIILIPIQPVFFLTP